MRTLIEQVAGWAEPFAVATIAETWRSAPRMPGAALAIDSNGTVVGSLSVGCVEADIYERCRDVLRTGVPELARYGVSDDEALAVGMTCGGEVEVFVERIVPAALDLRWLREQLSGQHPAGIATIIEGPEAGAHVLLDAGEAVGRPLDGELVRHVREGFASAGDDTAVIVRVPSGDGDVRVLVQAFLPPPRLLIFGAVEFAAALASAGRLLGYHVVVCDARPVFATPERFVDAHEVVVEWPHDYLARTGADERSAICVLTHDPKFDELLLELAVTLPAGYIVAMGSRRTHDQRTARLVERGLTEAQLDRIRSPIGLDLGGRTPAETAVSILAEIIAMRWGGSAAALRGRSGAIHQHSTGASTTIPPKGRAVAGPHRVASV